MGLHFTVNSFNCFGGLDFQPFSNLQTDDK
jgi:hypothetical protein